MTIYVAYGLAIRSDLPLPELVSAWGNEAEVDITIRLGEVECAAGAGNGGESYVHRGPGESRIFSSEGGRFLVRGGREIVVDPNPGAAAEQLRAYILGSAMAILLHQRGLLVLHASAVAVDGGAVGILGRPGQGKSTLVAALHKRGYDVVTDDMMSIETRSRPFTVYPGFPQIRLWPDTVVFLGEAPEALPRVGPGLEKRARKVRRGFASGRLPLKRIYVLADGDRGEVHPLRPAAACIELVGHSYVTAMLKATNTAARHLRQCAAVARSVAICRLDRPLRLSALPEVAAAVEEDLARAEHSDPDGQPPT